MRRHVAFIVVLTLAAAPAALAGRDLTSSLAAGDDASVVFTLANEGSDVLYVPRWQTPIDGLEADIFRVTRDGEPVPYTGKVVKRAEARAEDYIELQPGDSFTMLVDLSGAYDMAAGGRYAVRYRARMDEALDWNPRDGEEGLRALAIRFRPSDVESNEVDLWVEDRGLVAGAFKKPGGGGGGDYNGCTTQQVSTLNTAKSNATAISGLALTYLNRNSDPDLLYKTWFDYYNTQGSRGWATATDHFGSIYGAFSTAHVTFDCTCNQNYYAYVYPTQPYRIYLCRVFWNAPALGRDSKAGTLVHEMSHFNVTARTSDYVYGATGAANLAKTDPTKALNNADNHEYFAEDQ